MPVTNRELVTGYLSSIADAIRTKLSISASMTISEMISTVKSIQKESISYPLSMYESLFTRTVEVAGGTTEYIGEYAFAYCSSLRQVSFQNCSKISTEAFAFCSSLSQAYFPKCTSIGYHAFYGCQNLTELYLNQVSSVTLITDAFGYGTSIAPIERIFVPSSLYASFVSQYSASFFSSAFVSM